MISYEETEIIFTFLAAIVILLGLIIFIVFFAFLFQRRQVQYRQEKASLKAQYEKEILQSQIEVQNSTLQYVGQELHDNIGQLLSVTKINLGVMEECLAEKNFDEFAMNFHQANDLVTEIISAVRSLNKSLDTDSVQEFGLTDSMAHELQRIRKTKKFVTDLIIHGERYALGYEREIILFRIAQEVLNNALKHSSAKNIEVTFDYKADSFALIISDDGKGFDYSHVMSQSMADSGAGLRNIKRRAALINFNCELLSKEGQGTKYILTTQASITDK